MGGLGKSIIVLHMFLCDKENTQYSRWFIYIPVLNKYGHITAYLF